MQAKKAGEKKFPVNELMQELASAIEARAPGAITTKWRGRRLVIHGTARERVTKVYINFENPAFLIWNEIKCRAGQAWPNLERAVKWELLSRVNPQLLEDVRREAARAGEWDGNPATQKSPQHGGTAS